MKRLNPKQILLIHDELVEKYGGSFGIRDENLFESAIFQPFVTFGGLDLYQTVFDKAAALLRSLVKNHPFIDGNKRTGIVSAQLLIEANDYVFKAGISVTEKFVRKIASTKVSVEEISHWLKKHSICPVSTK
ncbi:MAG: type II toxin-antitoxin system death-on-curing family toxin [Patescibacteria group bacterium]|nr:type II toxin-antitoxin system death-on-curing family toxin [Patescibacteria group bacterium]